MTCPLGKDRDTARTRFALLDRLEKRPMHTTFDSLPKLTEGWAVTALSDGLADRESWPYLVDALDRALNDDDPDDLAWLAMITIDRDEDGSYAGTTFGRSHLLVTCSDWPPTPWDDTVPSRDVLDNHPLWARVEPPSAPPCDGWTGELRETLLVGAEWTTPVLVIGNEGDTVTPIGDTEDLAHEIVRSRFVSVAADGHGAYGGDNDCADGVVDDISGGPSRLERRLSRTTSAAGLRSRGGRPSAERCPAVSHGP